MGLHLFDFKEDSASIGKITRVRALDIGFGGGAEPDTFRFDFGQAQSGIEGH